MALCLTLSLAAASRGQGVIAPTAGPINSAMAGASVAAPVDFGASYWNPAILSALPRNEFLLGTQILIPSIHMTSFLPAGAIGGVFPPESRYGVARSDSGVASNLATGVAFRLSDDSPTTFGLGVFGLVGGNVNFAGSYSTPILTPRIPPNFFGVGPIYANTSFLAIAATASRQVTDRLALAGGPIILSGSMAFEPAFFAPNRSAQQILPTFAPGTNGRPFWGAGFQVGLFYDVNDNWNLGFSYKSPIWQERYGFNSYTPNFAPRRIGIQAQIPQILSWGIAYKGFERALIDVDFRYFDYADTSLYGQKPIDGGLGWQSIFAVAVGGQYQLTEKFTVRAGYLYNVNPIRSTFTLFNIQAPGFLQHMLGLGATYKLTEDISLSVAWTHQFRNAIVGDVIQIPGENIKLDGQSDSIVVGLNVQFGAPRKAAVDNSLILPAAEGAVPPPPDLSTNIPPAGTVGAAVLPASPTAEDAQLAGKIASAIGPPR
jgi:long-chain fatty acid transport protein